jgi:hypothetical protein
VVGIASKELKSKESKLRRRRSRAPTSHRLTSTTTGSRGSGAPADAPASPHAMLATQPRTGELTGRRKCARGELDPAAGARPRARTQVSRARTGKPDRCRYACGSSNQPPLPWARAGELNSGRRRCAQASSNPAAASARGGARPNHRYHGNAPASSNPGTAGGHGRARTWPPPPQARAGEGHDGRFRFLTISVVAARGRAQLRAPRVRSTRPLMS